MTSRRGRMRLAMASTVVLVSLVMPSLAWARYGSTGAETNIFATRVFVAPGEPSCGAINLLAVTFSWTAPSDAAFISSYDFGKGSASGGPYTYTNVPSGRSITTTVSGSGAYVVVRSVRDSWKGVDSAERHVTSVGGLGVIALCP